MIIENTDLEYSEADKTCLEYYLGEHCEDMFKWAQRVYSSCKEYAETSGLGYDTSKYPKGMPRVYKRQAKDLWEEKKACRRIAFMRDFSRRFPNEQEIKQLKNIQKITAKGEKFIWSNSHSDIEIDKLKKDSRYKTATQSYQESIEKKLESLQKQDVEVRVKTEKLLNKGFDIETVSIIFPQGEKFLKSE